MTALWRKAFDAIERPLATTSEAWIQSETFMDLTATAYRLQRRMLTDLQQATERWLHLWGWVSRGDVLRLTNQIGNLERQLRELQQANDRREPPAPSGNEPSGRAPAPPRTGRARNPRTD
jgi:hypothetical protein